MSNIISGVKQRKAPAWFIHEIRITPIVGHGGLSHQLYIRSGAFTFEGNFDNNMHNFFEVVSTAMKFFGVKYGLITIDNEGNARPTKKGMH